MHDSDRKMINKHWPRWAKDFDRPATSCALLSPDDFEIKLIESIPEVTGRKNILTINHWNLNDSAPQGYTWDLIVSSNIFMASSDPVKWFDNVLSVCRWLWLLEPQEGIRGNIKGQLGDDGDSMRYQYKEFKSSLVDAFSLESLGEEKILDCKSFPNDANNGYHIMAYIKGNL